MFQQRAGLRRRAEALTVSKARGGVMERPFVVHDPRFGALVVGHALLDKLYTGMRWAEGPAYFPAGRYLVWSDIPNNRLMRFDETDGSVSVFREHSNNANGNTTDHEGRLVNCDTRAWRVTRNVPGVLI